VTKRCDRHTTKQKAQTSKRTRDYDTKTTLPPNTLTTAARTRRFSVYWLLQDTIGDKQGKSKATEAEVKRSHDRSPITDQPFSLALRVHFKSLMRCYN